MAGGCCSSRSTVRRRSVASAAAVVDERRAVGVWAFYGELVASLRSAVIRWHLDTVVEVAMVVAWFAIRTVASVDGRLYLAWVVAAGLLALVSPRAGLVVFIATSVFYEPDNLARTLGARELVILPLAVGVALQVVADRFRWRPGVAIWLAVLLLLGTALGVVHTFLVFDQDFQWHAAQSWIGNMFAPVILLIAAAWTARDGSLRVLVVASGVGVAAAIVCLVEYVAPGTISGGPMAWVGFWKGFGLRLAGTIPSPNALSAQLMVPTMMLTAAVVLARDLRLRAIALVALLPVLVAQYLTFSRAPLIALYAFVVIVAWRFRRWAGIAVLLAGLLAGAIALPAYLQLRGSSVSEGAVQSGSILVASDEVRFRAWGAAAAMFQDSPLTGQGYLAYKALADVYGDPVLGSPHNEWLRIFAEEGLVVGLIAIAFLIATAVTLARVRGWLGTGLLAGFIGYVIAASFNNPLLFVRVSAVAFASVGVGLALAARARDATRTTPGASEDAPATTASADDPPLH
jgi:O-antigen ligase